MEEFSFRSRERSLQRFKNEIFDLLVIGGGITGAAVARDATSRGLKVALVERRDFAFGTSSRSSKLIHGGLRYLQNLEFGLVFEALSERSFLLKTAPHLVRPLSFYLPVYKGDSHGRGLLSVGLWLYDLLALFRTPEFHQGISRKKLLSQIPFLKSEGLRGGFRYHDASMWDDALTIETLRAAQQGGAAVANYIEAVKPIWNDGVISGFIVRDCEKSDGPDGPRSEWELKAHRTVLCVGPWTDELGQGLSESWETWLKPSKGVHLIFDHKRIPIPGAMVMSHPTDGRISFVIPRTDYGQGVVIVGTTDGPTHQDPEKAQVEKEDVQYLMDLLTRYFPDLNLTHDDILSAYVGVRPLMDENQVKKASEDSRVLQKVSREHHIDRGPGGTVVVAGGKYTTHRIMAQEIVDFALKAWKEDALKIEGSFFPASISSSKTDEPVNDMTTAEAIKRCREEILKRKIELSDSLVNRYGEEALWMFEFQERQKRKMAESTSSVGLGVAIGVEIGAAIGAAIGATASAEMGVGSSLESDEETSPEIKHP